MTSACCRSLYVNVASHSHHLYQSAYRPHCSTETALQLILDRIYSAADELNLNLNLEYGSRTFRISAPKIWNLLPASIRNSKSLHTFRRHLKHIIFSQPILTPNDHPLSTGPDYRSRRFINHLLTYLLILVVILDKKVSYS